MDEADEAAAARSLATGFSYSHGPLYVHVCDFGQEGDRPFAGILGVGCDRPLPLPADMEEKLLGHMARRERILVLAGGPSQICWAKALVERLAARGRRQ